MSHKAKGMAVLLGCVTPYLLMLFYLISHYRRKVSNEQHCKGAGWNFLEKMLSEQDIIREQGGKFCKIINKQGDILLQST